MRVIIKETLERWLQLPTDESHPYAFFLRRRKDTCREASTDTLTELEGLIDVATQLEDLKLDDEESVNGGGVYYVKLSPDTDVLLEYRVVQDDHFSVLERRLHIAGQSASLQDVIRLYKQMRAGQV